MENQIKLYTSQDGEVSLQVSLDKETVWLTQAQMAMLFDTSTDNIGLHLKNIYLENELLENSTTENFSVVRQEGTRQVKRTLKLFRKSIKKMLLNFCKANTILQIMKAGRIII